MFNIEKKFESFVFNDSFYAKFTICFDKSKIRSAQIQLKTNSSTLSFPWFHGLYLFCFFWKALGPAKVKLVCFVPN